MIVALMARLQTIVFMVTGAAHQAQHSRAVSAWCALLGIYSDCPAPQRNEHAVSDSEHRSIHQVMSWPLHVTDQRERKLLIDHPVDNSAG